MSSQSILESIIWRTAFLWVLFGKIQLQGTTIFTNINSRQGIVRAGIVLAHRLKPR